LFSLFALLCYDIFSNESDGKREASRTSRFLAHFSKGFSLREILAGVSSISSIVPAMRRVSINESAGEADLFMAFEDFIA
jgi:hypothetical protein